MIPFVAFAVAALINHVQGEPNPICSVWRRGARLWVPTLILTAAWVMVYLVVVDQRRWSSDLSMTWALLRRSFTHGVVPGLVGGPWDMAALGSGLTVGNPTDRGHGAGLDRACGRGDGFAATQASNSPGLDGGTGVCGGLPDPDIPDALVTLHRPGTGADLALPARPGSRPCPAVRRRILRTQPHNADVGRITASVSRRRVAGRGVHRQQPLFDIDVSVQLARQSDQVLPADRCALPGRRARYRVDTNARSGGRPARSCSGWPGRRTLPATCSRSCGRARISA